MSVKPYIGPHELNQLRERIDRLVCEGVIPIEVIMSPETWERLKRQYCANAPGLTPRVISSRDVLGLRNKLVPGAQGAVVRYFGGMDFPPDQAVEDGFIDLSKFRVGRGPTLGRGE